VHSADQKARAAVLPQRPPLLLPLPRWQRCEHPQLSVP
jgi:hypothetical protein